MRRPPSLVLVLLGVAVVPLLLAATPVPSPVHVQPGGADADGRVAWVPAVQRITGPVGELVPVDLALDDGGEHDVVADVAVRTVDIDPVEGPRAAGRSEALRLAVERVVLRPGDRGAFRAVAEIPPRPTIVAVQARLHPDDSTGPLALVLLAPEGAGADATPAELTTGIGLDGGRAVVRVDNASSYPVLVDVAVSAATWVGPTDEVQVADVLVPGGGRRFLDVELSRGLGRRTAAVAVAERDAPAHAVARATAAQWPARTVWTLAAAALVLLAAAAAVRVLRRS